jgi:type 2A phosphatase activator TIP41
MEELNMELLKRPDPILFYESLSLYEDELGDNGCSELSVRIRVMPEFFLILLRFFLRVDNVLFRIYDTRIFHEWKHNYVIKEISHVEMPYDDALQFLRQERLCNQAEGEDLSVLSDSQYISSIVDKKQHQVFFLKQKYNI